MNDPHRSPTGDTGDPHAADREHLVDLLASALVDGAPPGPELAHRAEQLGVDTAEVERRAEALRRLRTWLREPTPATDDLSLRRRERSVEAAMAAFADRPRAPASPARRGRARTGRARTGRARPWLVAAALVALGGIGAAALAGGGGSDQLADADGSGAAESSLRDTDTFATADGSDPGATAESGAVTGDAPEAGDAAPVVTLGAFERAEDVLAALSAAEAGATTPPGDAAALDAEAPACAAALQRNGSRPVAVATVAGVPVAVWQDPGGALTVRASADCDVLAVRDP
jgi:nitrogen fixation-related uncharacterized protein